MEIIAAAALIAVGIVLAAVVYGKTHAARASAGGAQEQTRGSLDTDLADRAAALTTRDEALGRREAALETERAALAEARQDLERALERVSGLSAARAKQLLLQEIEEQARP